MRVRARQAVYVLPVVAIGLFAIIFRGTTPTSNTSPDQLLIRIEEALSSARSIRARFTLQVHEGARAVEYSGLLAIAADNQLNLQISPVKGGHLLKIISDGKRVSESGGWLGDGRLVPAPRLLTHNTRIALARGDIVSAFFYGAVLGWSEESIDARTRFRISDVQKLPVAIVNSTECEVLKYSLAVNESRALYDVTLWIDRVKLTPVKRVTSLRSEQQRLQTYEDFQECLLDTPLSSTLFQLDDR